MSNEHCKFTETRDHKHIYKARKMTRIQNGFTDATRLNTCQMYPLLSPVAHGLVWKGIILNNAGLSNFQNSFYTFCA